MLEDEKLLREFLDKNDETKYIRLQWIDFSGVLRTRFVPVTRCLRIARGEENYLLPQVSMIIPIATAPKCYPTSNNIEIWKLVPDWSSLRPCGFRKSHASVMCSADLAAEEFRGCPRMLLLVQLEELEKQWGKILAGFEIEIMLLGPDHQPLRQLDRLNSYQTTAGLRGHTLDIVEEVLECLRASSINIEHFHTETHDQIEFALSPEPVLQAIDSFILAQETIRTVFIKYNIKATMTPKPLLNGPTNGIHLHLSVDRLVPPYTDYFLAGILAHMSSLCAFGMANFDGYVRTVKDAAGAWIGFGTENRDLPVRKINEKHWELRMMDGTSNPYLFVAAVLGAGLYGFDEEQELIWKDCNVFPNSLTHHDRIAYGLEKRMPDSLQEAVESLKADSKIREWVPDLIMDSYISVKEKEVEEFQKMTEEQRRLRFLEYF